MTENPEQRKAYFAGHTVHTFGLMYWIEGQPYGCLICGYVEEE